MARILILSSSTGEGHNAAAKSLQEGLEARGHQTLTVDIHAGRFPGAPSAMASSYNLSIKYLPMLYGLGYELTNRRWFYRYMMASSRTTTSRRIRHAVDSFSPDVMVSTHPFSPSALHHYQETGRVKVPLVQVVTDLKPHWSYASPYVSGFIVSDEATGRELAAMGVDETRIHAWGIPVRKEFRDLAQREPLSAPRPGTARVLVMGGSMGLKSMGHVVHYLAAHPAMPHLVVVCGRNEKLRLQLSRELAQRISEGQVEILGFTSEVARLMAESHVVVSKPGGLTTSEAILAGKPMLVPFYIPGQEADNLQHLEELGIGRWMPCKPGESCPLSDLVANPDLYARMVERARSYARGHNADKTLDLLETLAKSH